MLTYAEAYALTCEVINNPNKRIELTAGNAGSYLSEIVRSHVGPAIEKDRSGFIRIMVALYQDGANFQNEKFREPMDMIARLPTLLVELTKNEDI